LADLARDVLEIAEQGLKRRAILDSSGDDETSFLRALWEIAESGVSPSEALLELYETDWQQSVDPIYREFAY
ncbi:MAG: glutamate--cysteine ligase, partial [Alphaproteobacteria bacterium]